MQSNYLNWQLFIIFIIMRWDCISGSKQFNGIPSPDLPSDSIRYEQFMIDHQKHIIAHKDAARTRCLLEYFHGDPINVPALVKSQINALLFQMQKMHSSRQVWGIGGPRIFNFCHGIPTYFLRKYKDGEHQPSARLNYENNNLSTQKQNRKNGQRDRPKRQTRHFFVGRVGRGQSQSQYINYGDNSRGGKAEAESTLDGSKATVSGTNGMGQAQSQSGPLNCQECIASQPFSPNQNVPYTNVGRAQNKPLSSTLPLGTSSSHLHNGPQNIYIPPSSKLSPEGGDQDEKLIYQPRPHIGQISWPERQPTTAYSQQSDLHRPSIEFSSKPNPPRGQSSVPTTYSNSPHVNNHNSAGVVPPYPLTSQQLVATSPNYSNTKEDGRTPDGSYYHNKVNGNTPSSEGMLPNHLQSSAQQPYHTASTAANGSGQNSESPTASEHGTYSSNPLLNTFPVNSYPKVQQSGSTNPTHREKLNENRTPMYDSNGLPRTSANNIPQQGNQQQQQNPNTNDGTPNVPAPATDLDRNSIGAVFLPREIGQPTSLASQMGNNQATAVDGLNTYSGNKPTFTMSNPNTSPGLNDRLSNRYNNPYHQTTVQKNQVVNSAPDRLTPIQGGQIDERAQEIGLNSRRPLQSNTQSHNTESANNGPDATNNAPEQHTILSNVGLGPHTYFDPHNSGKNAQNSPPGTSSKINRQQLHSSPGHQVQPNIDFVQQREHNLEPGMQSGLGPAKTGGLYSSQDPHFSNVESGNSQLDEQNENTHRATTTNSPHEKPSQFYESSQGDPQHNNFYQNTPSNDKKRIVANTSPLDGTAILHQPNHNQIIQPSIGNGNHQYQLPHSGRPSLETDHAFPPVVSSRTSPPQNSNTVVGPGGSSRGQYSPQHYNNEAGQSQHPTPDRRIPTDSYAASDRIQDTGKILSSHSSKPQTFPSQFTGAPNKGSNANNIVIQQPYTNPQYIERPYNANNNLAVQENIQGYDFDQFPSLTTFEDSDSSVGDTQAQTSIQQFENTTQLSASAQGEYQNTAVQSQVTGSYTGSATFKASAGSNDGARGTLTEISANGREGAVSTAQGRGGRGQSQSQVQFLPHIGKTISQAQSQGFGHGSHSQVSASQNGGKAHAQAKGAGSTSSQAQIAFNAGPVQQNGAKASAQSGRLEGQSQAQLQNKFQNGVSFTGMAQAASQPSTNMAQGYHEPLTSKSLSPQNYPHADYYDYLDGDQWPEERFQLVAQPSNTQHQKVAFQPSKGFDYSMYRSSDGFPKSGTILQPGDHIPGSQGYQIPEGFRGRIHRVISAPHTVGGSRAERSHAHTIILHPSAKFQFKSGTSQDGAHFVSLTNTQMMQSRSPKLHLYSGSSASVLNK